MQTLKILRQTVKISLSTIARCTKFARPLADGVSENQQQSSSPPFLRSSELPLALAKGLRRAPDPGNFRGSTSATLFFSFLFSMLLFDSNLLRFSAQHDPILDPKLAPISPSFALLFPITFPTRFPTSFWTDFGPQIDFKIDQKSIRNVFQNQATNKPYFSFIFDQISKTISCSSKMVDVQKSFQNLVFLHVF